MSKQRIAISLSPEDISRLDDLNQERFGGESRGRSAVVAWALDIAARILRDRATMGAQSGSEALELYLADLVKSPSQPVSPALADLLQRIDGVLKDLSTYPDTHVMDTTAAARQDMAETLTRVLLGRSE